MNYHFLAFCWFCIIFHNSPCFIMLFHDIYHVSEFCHIFHDLLADPIMVPLVQHI